MQTTNIFRTSNFVAALFAATLFLGACKDTLDQQPSPMAKDANAKVAASSETAQSVMVGLNVNAPMIEGEITWNFNDDAAAAYFSGGTSNQRKQVARNQKCTFYSGGTLVSEVVGGGQNAVTISPVSNPVSARTAWSSSVTGSTVSNATVDITIAGESVVLNKGKEKYSFSLTNSDGTSRITNLKVEVTGQTDVTPGHTILVNDDENACLAGFLYTENGGKFGSATAIEKLKNGFMGDIIASNKFGSTSVCGNAAIAVVDQLSYSLEAGNYTITVSGNVKGNESNVSSPFSVTGNFTVGGLGNCGN